MLEFYFAHIFGFVGVVVAIVPFTYRNLLRNISRVHLIIEKRAATQQVTYPKTPQLPNMFWWCTAPHSKTRLRIATKSYTKNFLRRLFGNLTFNNRRRHTKKKCRKASQKCASIEGVRQKQKNLTTRNFEYQMRSNHSELSTGMLQISNCSTDWETTSMNPIEWH